MTDTATATTVWTIDPSHSVVEFSVKHMMFATAKGRFSDVTGTITLDNEDVTRSTVAVEIGAASIDTHDAKRDEHLRSADFFDVETYPTLTCRSTSVEAAGGLIPGVCALLRATFCTVDGPTKLVFRPIDAVFVHISCGIRRYFELLHVQV